jgi:chaperonin GroEL
MRKKFSLFEQLEENIKAIDKIDNAIKITLGPTGKNGIVSNDKGELKFLTSGSLLLKSLDFEANSANVILKLLEQAAVKTSQVSGDGSTTTVLIACQLLKTSLKFLVNGYNVVFLNNGLRKLCYFLLDKIVEYSKPVANVNEIVGVLKTSLGKKVNTDFLNLLTDCVSQITKDGLILVEENNSPLNEVEIVQGIELDKGYASSYFVNDLKNFETVYENPYILITNTPINSINQIRDVIEFVKKNNKPLVIVAENINKDVVSTLVLNNIQKKLKVVVVKYTSINFIKDGILEDLATLTYSNYFVANSKKPQEVNLQIEDLGQAEKVIVKKNKTTFLISKFVKLIAKRRVNELNRELLLCETDYEKSIFKMRIARLSGQIIKIKIGLSNKYQIEEERQKIENAIMTVRSALEEGILPGGGSFYFHILEELSNWSTLNLIGDEFFANQIIAEAFLRPIKELLENTNNSYYKVSENLKKLGYPFSYDLIKNEFCNSLNSGLLDSAKSVRGTIWNSITIVSTILTSD